MVRLATLRWAGIKDMGQKTMIPTRCAEGWRLARNFSGLLKSRRWHVAAIVGLILVVSLLEGISLSLLVPLTQAFTSGGEGRDTTNLVSLPYQDWLVGYEVADRLAVLGVALMMLFGLKNAAQYLREALQTRLWLGIGADTRMRSLAAVLQRPYRYFLDRKQGALVQHLYHEPYHVAFFVCTGVDLIANVLAVTALLGLLFLVSWPVTIFMLTLGALFGGLVWRFSHVVQTGGEERQQVEADAVSLLTESIGGVRQIKVFSAEDRIQTVYRSLIERFRDLHVRHWLAILLPHRMTELFWVGVLGLLLCLPALGIVGEAQTVLPVVAVFTAVAFRIGPYLSRISQGWLHMKFLSPALRIVGDLLEKPALPLTRGPGLWFRVLSRGVQLENVSFSYGGDKLALDRISVVFNCGETTAIVGPSGAGKSTLVDLLVRLYEPSSGSITVDGVDLRDYDRDSWLAAIGFVSQDTFVFHGTVRDNIAFALPGCSMERIEEVARQANADAFIQRLPNGYETVIGDRGLKLSGGERQRIAIARALLRNPQVLIFDEATSALDNQAEAMIQDAIATIAKDRTVILIAHRLSTVIRADKIIVLEHGKIVEEGTHAALLKEDGMYAALYSKEST